MDNNLEKNVMDWLLEPSDIGVKYLTIRDLLETGTEELLATKNLAQATGNNPATVTILSTRERFGH
jgi:hypothetical protein